MTPKIRPSWLIGITTVGNAWLTTANPSAIRFPQVNADNTVSYLTDTQFRIAIGAGTGSGSIEGNVGLTDNRLVRSSGASGIEVSGSSVTLDDSGNMTTAGTYSGIGSFYPPATLGPGSTFKIENPTGNDLQIIYTTGSVVRVSIPDSGDIELNDFVLVDGLESSDDISTAGVLQAGSINTLAYSRLGTGATSHALNGPEDILVSGDAEVNGTLFADGNASIAGLTVPSGGILGVITISNAATGNVGEIVESSISAGSAVSLTSTVTATITSISLTAGDWDVEGVVSFSPTAATYTASRIGSISTTTSLSGNGTDTHEASNIALATNSNFSSATITRKRINVNSITTIYLLGMATFSLGTVGGFGTITARRVR